MNSIYRHDGPRRRMHMFFYNGHWWIIGHLGYVTYWGKTIVKEEK